MHTAELVYVCLSADNWLWCDRHRGTGSTGNWGTIAELRRESIGFQKLFVTEFH